MPRRQRSASPTCETVARPPVARGDKLHEYLATTFYLFLQQPHNHVGIYFPLKGKFTEKCWIGLREPPVFYLFSKITPIADQKWTPQLTTKERWDQFTRVIGGAQLSWTVVHNALMKGGFVMQVSDCPAILNDSLINAVEAYRGSHKEMAEKHFKRKSEAAQHKLVGKDLMTIHVEHIFNAWTITTNFGDLLRKYNND